ncbi:hypothetical protein KIN20_027714 [Parelaphostrongylus tenuis]|uniref:Uncharacterized protein n=1 Tax=Parelaphostrongylus tenuis TaxID=148309 RepID=A0AAD5QZW8_PARTN|nr:hypothetical protein KIN20_027714 [Parelaphostrongylus tenuis]
MWGVRGETMDQDIPATWLSAPLRNAAVIGQINLTTPDSLGSHQLADACTTICAERKDA